jgi:hypothetical protein
VICLKVATQLCGRESQSRRLSQDCCWRAHYSGRRAE